MIHTNDDYRIVNPVLRKVIKGIYEQRVSYPIRYYCDTRIERIHNQTFAQIFFMSRGCSHDLNGGCTMCNYGYGKEYKLDYEKVLRDIRENVKKLPKNIYEIVVGPTGSFLDEEEVPRELFLEILDILSQVDCREFTCETRADTITVDKLRLLKENIRSEKITLELGVESTNLWCLRNCINKNLSFEKITEAINTAHSESINICANIGIGFPFLNEKYCINSAVESIKKLLEFNISCIALFAYNIRPGTLLEWLWKRGVYDCISLWGLTEVLSHFSDEELRRIQISWYRNYYEDKSKILKMPYLCPSCEDEVLCLFDEYRNDPCRRTLQPLLDYDCSCKKKWYKQYQQQSNKIDFSDVKKIYTKMAMEFSIPNEVLEQELIYMYNSLDRKD